MSNISEEWVIYYAPVATQTEKLVLLALAHRTDDDGCDGYKSKSTLAQAAMCDPKTVQRTLNALKDRGVIQFGDQAVAAYIDVRYRPMVYDIQIPYSWFSAAQMAQVNEERARKGRPPLRPEDRPDLAPAPERVARSDKGTKVPQRRPRSLGPREQCEESSETRGDSESPLPETPRGDSESQPGGIEKVSRGDSESPNSLKQLPGFNSSSSDSFANAQESAGDGQQPSLLGDEDPAPAPAPQPKTGSRKKERTPEDQARFEQADKIATAWWARCDALGIPNIKRSNSGVTGFVGFRSMIERALAADCDVNEIKWALDDLRDPFPSAPRLTAAISKRRGVIPQQSSYGKPKVRVHIDNVPQADRDYAAAVFGDTPKNGASW
ncbi:helix-turn-helix domain-containing protein [Streptosporangium sp. NPDC048865]|uniref:helix-turn-helix domain-containing protein n=1 Tax=Streptosporangium sp. NPDC048865 TaxID=3155766 RepID=UPI0034492210